MSDKEPILLPQIHPEGMKVLQQVANFRISLVIDGKPQEFTVSEMTPHLLYAEAKRIAGIADPKSRFEETIMAMGGLLFGLRLAVPFATATIEIANQLDIARRELSNRGVPISIPPNAPKDLRW